MKWSALFSFFFLFSSVAVTAETGGQQILGKDWKLMNDELKSSTVLVTIKALQAEKVPLRQKPDDYANAIDWMLIYESEAVNWSIGSILATYLYENEPQTRPALDRLSKEKPS